MAETDYAQICMFCGQGIVFLDLRWTIARGHQRQGTVLTACEANPIDRVHHPKPRDAESQIMRRLL